MFKIEDVDPNNNPFEPITTLTFPVIGAGAAIINAVLIIGFIGGLRMLIGGIGKMVKSKNQKKKNSRMKKALLVILPLGFSIVLSGSLSSL